MRTRLAVLTLLSALAMAPACGGGGDDDGGGGGGGGGDGADAGDVSTPDAAGPHTGLGQVCEGEGQGDCPTGFLCLPLGAASWCSKECENHTTCQEGYTGPGLPACVFQISTEGDAEPELVVCGIVCEGIEGTGCTAETCDGTCPEELTCTASLSNTMMQEVGKACE